MTEEELITRAMARLPHLGASAKEVADAAPRVLSCRLQPGSTRIALRLLGATQDLVLKYDPDATEEAFSERAKAQQFAFDRLGAGQVPALLSVDITGRSSLQHHVNARPVHELLELAELGLDAAPDILRSCGKWLGAYHKTTLQPARKINPDRMINWAKSLQNKVETRAPDVPRRDLFLTCAAQIPAMGDRARGQPTRIAASHGDMHLRNLLLGPDGCFGIDFEPLAVVPPAHDLARFLLRYGTWFDLGPDPLVAFWDGYGTPPKTDPALGYLLPILLLEDWLSIPKRKEDRSPKQQRRLRGILRMAEEVFAFSD